MTTNHSPRPRTLERFRNISFAVVACALAFAVKGTPVAHGNPPQNERPIAEARQTFENRCAGCHGLDGRGGERAPDIATSPKTQNRTDAALAQIITNGIPANGMPSFNSLDAPTIKAVIKYLRVLQGKSEGAAMPGNASAGKELFYGKARCAQCHLAAGSGGFLGPDLSNFARRRPPEEIRDAILHPEPDPRAKTAIVYTRDGLKYLGIIRNQDNLSLQPQSTDGAFHLFDRKEIERVEVQKTSLMPANYGTRLSPAELNDVVSFLMAASRSGDAKKQGGDHKTWEEKDDD